MAEWMRLRNERIKAQTDILIGSKFTFILTGRSWDLTIELASICTKRKAVNDWVMSGTSAPAFEPPTGEAGRLFPEDILATCINWKALGNGRYWIAMSVYLLTSDTESWGSIERRRNGSGS